MSSLIWSPDQLAAVDAHTKAVAEGDPDQCMAGAAGTGKTSLVTELCARFRDQGWGIRLFAPTGKAASRLHQVTGEEVVTIHSALFGRVQERDDGSPIFLDPRAPCPERTISVIDEGSMVDVYVHNKFIEKLPRGALALFAGDDGQLPPVDGPWGPHFDRPTSRLSTPHRQALDNPIIAIATDVRNGGRLPQGEQGDAYARRSIDILALAEQIAERRRAGIDLMVLTWDNTLRMKLNDRIRAALGRTQPIEAGDKLVVRINAYALGVRNGERLTVQSAVPWVTTPQGERAQRRGETSTEDEETWWVRTEEGVHVWVHLPSLDQDQVAFRQARKGAKATQGFLWLHVHKGEASTVHVAQGSEYDEVHFVLGKATRSLAARDRDLARKLVYTALTRAKKRFYAHDL